MLVPGPGFQAQCGPKRYVRFAPRILLYDDAVGAIAAPPSKAADPARKLRRSILFLDSLIAAPRHTGLPTLTQG